MTWRPLHGHAFVAEPLQLPDMESLNGCAFVAEPLQVQDMRCVLNRRPTQCG